MPTCQEVAEQAATEHLEKAMPPRERLGAWTHLRVRPNCRTYLRQPMDTIAWPGAPSSAPTRPLPRTKTG